MAAAGTTTLDSLSDDVLGAIFLLLLPMVRAGTVPRVCRRWHRITANASMWPILRLTPRDSSVVAWLRQRSAGLRRLTLDQGPSNASNITQSPGTSGADITRALAAVAPSATQLQHLQLCTGSTDASDSFDIAQLACIFNHLRGLTNLEIYHIGTPFQPASLDNTLACLPALEAISLDFRKASSPAASTGPHSLAPLIAFPCSLLRCTRLTSMDLSGTYTSPHVCNIPTGITALQRLQHLGLQHCLRTPLPRSLSQMTRLTSLDVTQYTSEFQDLLFRDHEGPVPLPASLVSLDVPRAPVESLWQLTALQSLRLTASEGQPSDPSRFSMLGQLTDLYLDRCTHAIWTKFEGCTGLRMLHLHGWDIGDPQLLPFQQLTQLQLHDGDYDVSDILIMISALPRLEVLEVLDFTIEALELRAFDDEVLSRLPKLWLVDLSGSLLWDDPSNDDPSGYQPVQGDDMVDYLPVRVAQQLLHLQRAYPNITWVVDGM